MYEFFAVYKDGKMLRQYQDNKEYTFNDIDQNLLSCLAWADKEGHLVLVNVQDGTFWINGVEIEPELKALEYRPIMFTRRQAVFSPEVQEGVDPFTYGHAVGWQARIDGHNVQYFAIVRVKDHGIEWQRKTDDKLESVKVKI